LLSHFSACAATAWCAADELLAYTGDAISRQQRAAELVSLTSLSTSSKKRRNGGVRINAPGVKRALLEAEEAELMQFYAPWSDSDEDDNGDDNSGGGGGGEGEGGVGGGGGGDAGYVSSDDERPLADAFGIRAGAANIGCKTGPKGGGGGVRAGVVRPGVAEAGDVVDETIKDGLTPDWVVDAGCRIFGLNTPTVADPIIRGLLDPCTNNNRNPNISAEKTYDRSQDGLKQENPWKDYYVILNPSYEAQVQWRFINRAINEVEWGFCPGVLLICRNSTDTSYFQRLVPFPRIFLRRDAIRFKDYSNTPIGFGIAVFCLGGGAVNKQHAADP
jgi:hypothetical protein